MNVTKNTETKVIVRGVTITLSHEEAKKLKALLAPLSVPLIQSMQDASDGVAQYTAKELDWVSYNLYFKLGTL